jgi:hypothetical protein
MKKQEAKNNEEARNKNWEKKAKEKNTSKNVNLTRLRTRSEFGLIYIGNKMAAVLLIYAFGPHRYPLFLIIILSNRYTFLDA